MVAVVAAVAALIAEVWTVVVAAAVSDDGDGQLS